MRTVSLSSPSLSPATNPTASLDFRKLSLPARISGTKVEENSRSTRGNSTKADGCMRACLVAIVGSSVDGNTFSRNEYVKFGDLGFNGGHVAGILTVDTLADFLPRKGPLQQRRTGIAYISNVAVRPQDRRKGIAKRLIAKAEALARSWDCRAIALHCDANNPGATQLYLGQAFKCIKVPERAKWPQPTTSPGIRFNFMMKLLSSGVGINPI